MSQDELSEVFNATSIYALAVLLVILGATLCGVLLKHFYPDVMCVKFAPAFFVAACVFKAIYTTFDSVHESGGIYLRYLHLDAFVLLAIYSFVMGLAMYIMELRRKLESTRSTVQETVTVIKTAAGEAQSRHE